MILTLFCIILLGFLDFSQKPPGGSLPPSDTLDVGFVLGFGMNRLAAMSICQAARHCSCFFLGLRFVQGSLGLLIVILCMMMLNWGSDGAVGILCMINHG